MTVKSRSAAFQCIPTTELTLTVMFRSPSNGIDAATDLAACCVISFSFVPCRCNCVFILSHLSSIFMRMAFIPPLVSGWGSFMLSCRTAFAKGIPETIGVGKVLAVSTVNATGFWANPGICCYYGTRRNASWLHMQRRKSFLCCPFKTTFRNWLP